MRTRNNQFYPVGVLYVRAIHPFSGLCSPRATGNSYIMKKQIAVLIGLLGALTTNAQTLQFYNATRNFTLWPGDKHTVGFYAQKIKPNYSAQVVLTDIETGGNNFFDLVAIDLPLKNGVNGYEFSIPFSWWPTTGKYRAGIRVIDQNTGVISSCTRPGVLEIKGAIWHPRAGDVFSQGAQVLVVWTTRAQIIADFFQLSLINDDDTSYRELLEGDVDPFTGRTTVQLPSGLTGNSFRIAVDGYMVLEEFGFLFNDLTESSESETFRIN